MEQTIATTPVQIRRHGYARHALAVRIMHWINVVALTILFMSGLQIFNAHPALYWGKSSYTGRPALLEMGSMQLPDGSLAGTTRIGSHTFDTTGVLGASRDRAGEWSARGFPWWITIPDNRWLSMARTWHFFFAWVFVLNGLAYLIYSIASRHLARDLWPSRQDWRSIGQSIIDHVRFKHPTGEAAKRYNVLQKLAYLTVIFVLLPLIVLMGLGMSPRLDSVLAGWVDLFGGRQSARTIHFAVAWLLVAFVAIHVFEVIISGAWNHIRSMITGRYEVQEEVRHDR
ncbi:MAG: cytochrome b/b6 domain-containing protein [Pseudomonadota bacterium]|nr:cytochrome b/b6 domain-containing protein [Pseudomonadota bacterium]